MQIAHRLSMIALLCVAACGCTPHKIHLVAQDSNNTGDILIAGHSGVATWSWGTQHFTEQLEVTANHLISAGVESSGGLELTLHNGTTLGFASEQGVVACTNGCDSVHMPIVWRQIH